MGSLKIVEGEKPVQAEAGAKDKEPLGRWANVNGGFSSGIETHLPALTSRPSGNVSKESGVRIPVQGISSQQQGVMERVAVLFPALKLRGCATSGCSSHLSEPHCFPCIMSKMMGRGRGGGENHPTGVFPNLGFPVQYCFPYAREGREGGGSAALRLRS